MEFRTKVEIDKNDFAIGYKDKLIFLGSCFTENIGNKLSELKFLIDLNPFGIIYNPVSVENSLKILMARKNFTKNDIFFDNDLWFSYFHHSRFSNPDQDKCLESINLRIDQSSKILQQSEFLFITFGTSWVYQLKETGEIVSNCHKTQASKFNRILLKPKEIADTYSKLIQNLNQQNPKLKIIFTVSPIRHWKDGAVGNQLSKATLIVAIQELLHIFSNVFYFPSYEIVMDELRDYRFYDEDMLHINQTGINYIWERFCETYFEAETLEIMKNIDKLNKAMSHRPINLNSESHKQFRTKNLQLIDNIKIKYPFLNFQKEIEYFSVFQ